MRFAKRRDRFALDALLIVLARAAAPAKDEPKQCESTETRDIVAQDFITGVGRSEAFVTEGCTSGSESH